MAQLIDLSDAFKHPMASAAWRAIQWPVERLLAIDHLNRKYDRLNRVLTSGDAEHCPFETALDILQVRYHVDDSDLARIPEQGPLVVVANHPFGGIEGIIMGAMLLQRRKDVRILGNYLLKKIIGIGDRIIAVDPFATPTSSTANRGGLKQSLAWLKKEGALAIFPAGEVASWQRSKARITDPPWNSHIGALIRMTRATALPVFFPGRNGAFFHLLGMVHPLLRTALLPRELVNKKMQTLSVHIGSPIEWKKLARCADDASMTQLLRNNTEIMVTRTHTHRPNTPLKRLAIGAKRTARMAPVIHAAGQKIIARDVQGLPEDQCLIQRGDFGVYFARSVQIPHVLNEIGRLREVTFRQVGEGTGQSIDLDRFDDYYLHLFLWNHATSELVGAYRMGLVDHILHQYGPKGLYTSELFHFKPAFVDQLTHAIEVGRSFIRSEYQKKYNSLILIWRGIGAFMGRHPQYKILFGPVSISSDYHKLSKTLLVRFLKQNNFNTTLSALVRPRRPFRCPRINGLDQEALLSTFRDIDDISFLISEIEKDGKGIPVLLKHYLKLNGKLLSFNLDRAFSNALDGLLMVDLRETDPKILKRFAGPQGADKIRNMRPLAPSPGPSNHEAKP